MVLTGNCRVVFCTIDENSLGMDLLRCFVKHIEVLCDRYDWCLVCSGHWWIETTATRDNRVYV